MSMTRKSVIYTCIGFFLLYAGIIIYSSLVTNKNPAKLSSETALQMRRAFIQHIYAEHDRDYGWTSRDIGIQQYFGTYRGTIVVYMGSPLMYNAALRNASIAGYKIVFSSGQPLYAYRHGRFLDIEDAYMFRWLSKRDIAQIGAMINPDFWENNK